MKLLYKILLFILLIFSNLSLSSQFYCGHQMNFGKNRVQFDSFDWYYYRYEQFDTYFYSGGNDLALLTAKTAEKSFSEIESIFEHKLNKRIVFIIYQNLSDFRQSNIGLETNQDAYNIGGVTKIIDNIAFIYSEGDSKSIEQQVKAAITTIYLNELLYGEEFVSKLANTTLIQLPNWFTEGLITYISESWNSKLDNNIKNLIADNKFENLNFLNTEDAKIVGAAIWNYIGLKFGEQVISNIIHLTRVTKTYENGFLYVLGLNLDMLQQEIIDFYKSQYDAFNYKTHKPEGHNYLKKSKKNTSYYQLDYNSNSNSLVWAENCMGKYKIKMLNLNTNKTKTIFKREHKLEQIVDYSYPIIKWHPTGKQIGFIIEKKGNIYFITYDIESKKYRETALVSVEKIISFNYSHDGYNIVLSAFNHGQSDLFIYNIAANTIDNITKDNADDYNPQYINLSKQIIFSSNRKSAQIGNKNNNEVELQKLKDIFVYDIKQRTIKQITNTEFEDEDFANYNFNYYNYISNLTGVHNLYKAKIDSTITFIDTTTHYRHFLQQKQITNYQNNILEYNTDKYSESNTFVYQSNNKYQLLLNSNSLQPTSDSIKTMYRDFFDKQQSKQITQNNKIKTDSILTTQIATPSVDSINVNINNYIFDKEAIAKITTTPQAREEDTEENDTENTKNQARIKKMKMAKYFTTFYTNFLVSQVDFGFLNNSYQQFTGSAFYFNPGLNLILKIGSADLFEDYRITAGVRIAANFDSNEYLVMFENLKKRLNKQIMFHRQAIMNKFNDYYIKTFTNELFYILRYPLSQVDATQFSFNLRQNRNTALAIDNISLQANDYFDYWLGFKIEYIFDNTRKINTNILSGTRCKLFSESYFEINKKINDLHVIGGDIRYYQPIHKNFIIATRLATSFSFGNSKLIYYLGGVDNWINLSSKTPMFNSAIRIDPNINYVYQAVATNMRGFTQNTRNGTNFAVINTELRFPITSYFIKRPIRNEFIKNFQVITFFDIGSAWSGIHPFSGNNAYENDYYNLNPVEVIVHNTNFPIVSGYGIGIRSKLFGYFIRADWAWGIENNIIQPRIFYLSLNLDF